MKQKPITGIYTITNMVNDKIYLGYSSDCKSRKTHHFQFLRKGTHDNPYLQLAFNKYGEEAFVFEILEECEREFLASFEHYWGNLLNIFDRNFGYNIFPTHPMTDVRPVPESVRLKMSISQKGKSKGPHKEETRRKIGLAHKGRPKSQEHKEKIRMSLTGRKLSSECKAKIAAKNKGRKINRIKGLYKPTKETIEKIRKAISIPVDQYTKEGIYLKTWKSLAEVKDKIGVDPSNIIRVCKGKLKSTGGFAWKYSINAKPRIIKQTPIKNKLKQN